MPKHLAYDQKSLEAAIKDVTSGVLSKKAAAKKYGVPRATIQFRLSKNFKKTSCGPNTVLSEEEEELLAKWITECGKKGFPRRKDDVLVSVQDFLEKTGRKTIFKNNLPGKGWYQAFLKRHPKLTHRESEAVTRASANVSEADIRGWFHKILSHLEDVDALEILEDSNRIYNGDETNFLLCPKNSKVIAVKGSKNVYEIDQGTSKAAVTCMFSFSASGNVVPPMIIYPYVRIPAEISNSVPESWGIGHSDSGWMKSEVFYEYIANVFNKHLSENDIKRPVILFVDGHKTHLTYHLSLLCKELQIILIALYPNSTRILQPADVSAFKPIKSQWKKRVLEWRRCHMNEAITKECIAPILKTVVDNIKPETLKSGFKACGIFPWNPSAIDYEKCLGKSSLNKKTGPGENMKRSITLEQFCSIVGDELLKKFEDIEDVVLKENASPEFFTLYRVWEEFARQDCLSKDSSAAAENNETPTRVVRKENQIVGLTKTPNEFKSIKDTDQLVCVPSTSSSNNLPFLYHDHSYVTPTKKKEEEFHLRGEEENDDVDDCGRPIKLKRLDSSNSSLSEVLLWPETPKRKGKKQTERVPFVISSKQWRALYEEKENKKIKLEQEKEQRKRKREENKMEAEKKKRALSTKVVDFEKNSKISQNPSDVNQNDNNNRSKGLKFKKVGRPKPKTQVGLGVTYPSSTAKERKSQQLTKDMESQQVNKCHVNETQLECNSEQLGLCYKCGNNFKPVDTLKKVECDLCSKTFHKQCLDDFDFEDNAKIYICKSCIEFGEEISKDLKIDLT